MMKVSIERHSFLDQTGAIHVLCHIHVHLPMYFSGCGFRDCGVVQHLNIFLRVKFSRFACDP